MVLTVMTSFISLWKHSCSCAGSFQGDEQPPPPNGCVWHPENNWQQPTQKLQVEAETEAEAAIEVVDNHPCQRKTEAEAKAEDEAKAEAETDEVVDNHMYQRKTKAGDETEDEAETKAEAEVAETKAGTEAETVAEVD
ncbi:hypothetical protein S83_064365 [Arachis hypogaea]